MVHWIRYLIEETWPRSCMGRIVSNTSGRKFKGGKFRGAGVQMSNNFVHADPCGVYLRGGIDFGCSSAPSILTILRPCFSSVIHGSKGSHTMPNVGGSRHSTLGDIARGLSSFALSAPECVGSNGGWDGGESMAIELVRYSQLCRLRGPGEAQRCLEHGLTFLFNDSQAAESANGRMLLALATVHLDRGSILESLSRLKHASKLEGAPLEIRVAALEARSGLLLSIGKDEAAMADAVEALRLVDDAVDALEEGSGADKPVSNGSSSSGDAAVDHLLIRVHAALGLALCAQGKPGEGEKKFEEVGVSRSALGDHYIAAALLAKAQHVHAQGQLQEAQELYEKALAEASRAAAGVPCVPLASGMMAPAEISMGALAGMGQLAAHCGYLEEAELRLDEAITHAAKISGENHVRVGSVLSCLAHIHALKAQRVTQKVTELFKRSIDLLVGWQPEAAGGRAGCGSSGCSDCSMRSHGELAMLTRARYKDVQLRSSLPAAAAGVLTEQGLAAWKRSPYPANLWTSSLPSPTAAWERQQPAWAAAPTSGSGGGSAGSQGPMVGLSHFSSSALPATAGKDRGQPGMLEYSAAVTAIAMSSEDKIIRSSSSSSKNAVYTVVDVRLGRIIS
eukprot:TRINITY_DN6269_c0_g3_i1.p1 TRINITY_DN6269_c0_g3~~TRINITY_DN6269_c0_g3_i1.p1  ORF type:complete len:621 (-),score=150.22 TRINITY_DN6269_c0_g3_i1:22-1884(-)